MARMQPIDTWRVVVLGELSGTNLRRNPLALLVGTPIAPKRGLEQEPIRVTANLLGGEHFEIKIDHIPSVRRSLRTLGVTAPSAHQMLKTLEQFGLIDKQPGVARSIRLFVPPQRLPILGVD
jgi:hypothetical protein